MQVQEMKLTAIKPYENNPRKNDPAVEAVAASIKEFGWQQPIVVDSQMVIIAGHTRYKAAKKLKLKVVPVLVAEGLTEEQVKAYRLADNKSGELATWDESALLEELAQICDIDMAAFGFDALDSAFEEEGKTDEDAIPEIEEDEPPVSIAGEIYQLGRHRLMCGDSTNADDVARLMNGERADMVFTDPPYRMEAQGGSNQWVGRSAAKLGERIKDLVDFNPTEFLKRIVEIFNKGMNAYIFCNKDLVPDYLNWALQQGFAFNILFWKKPNALPLGGQHRPDLEYLLFFRKDAVWNSGLKNVNYSKCLEFGRENSTPHPTMKPVELIVNEVQISSKEGSVVVDLFGGSGSTLIACEKISRMARLMELDPKYCDVIRRRWAEYTHGEGCDWAALTPAL